MSDNIITKYKNDAVVTNSMTLYEMCIWNAQAEPYCAMGRSELMLEHPQQVVVEFKSGSDKKHRSAPLPADRVLDTKIVYLMVSMRQGRPMLCTDLATDGAIMRRTTTTKHYYPFTGINCIHRLAHFDGLLCSFDQAG